VRAHLVLKHGTVELGCLLLLRATPVTAYMLQGNHDANKYSFNITGMYQGFFQYHWTQTQSFETSCLCVQWEWKNSWYISAMFHMLNNLKNIILCS